jgi:hypothetical protein
MLSLLCVGLIAALAAQLKYWAASDSRVDQMPDVVELSVPPTARPAGQAANSLDQHIRTVLARPLFSPDRKPSGNLVAAGIELPRLSGIVASADAAVAIFQPAGGGRSVVVRHGESVAGWEVTAVALDAVDLRKGGERIVLRPRFTDAGPGNVAAAEHKQPRSRWEAAAETGVLRARWSNPQLQP